jgi:hypothetical protein
MLLVCGIIVAAMSSTCTTRKNTDDLAEPSSWDLSFRMIAATGIVLLITGIAEHIGPTWSGLLSPFPVFASVMAVFSHRTAGPSAAIHVLRGVITGSLAFGSFFVIVALMLRNQSMLASYSAGAFAGNFPRKSLFWTGRPGQSIGTSSNVDSFYDSAGRQVDCHNLLALITRNIRNLAVGPDKNLLRF